MNAPTLETTFGSRLVTLADGRPGLRSTITVTARKPDPHWCGAGLEAGAPVLDFIASDASIDRYDEIVDPAGWKLDNYRKNPVFQNSHKYGDILFTLGKGLVTETRQVDGRPALCQRTLFATEVNPMAKICYGLYMGGFLNAVSVGFIPIRWENGNTSTSPDSTNPQYRRKYLEQELLELSSVAVPANPNALVMGLKSGAIEASDIKEAAELIRSFVGSSFPLSQQSGAPDDNAGASDLGSQHAQLLQIARGFRDVLKGA